MYEAALWFFLPTCKFGFPSVLYELCSVMFTVFCIAVYKSCMDSCHRGRRKHSRPQQARRASSVASRRWPELRWGPPARDRSQSSQSHRPLLMNGLLGSCLVLSTFGTQRGRSTRGRGWRLVGARSPGPPRSRPGMWGGKGEGACVPNTSPAQQVGPFLCPSGSDASDAVVKVVFVEDTLAGH